MKIQAGETAMTLPGVGEAPALNLQPFEIVEVNLSEVPVGWLEAGVNVIAGAVVKIAPPPPAAPEPDHDADHQ